MSLTLYLDSLFFRLPLLPRVSIILSFLFLMIMVSKVFKLLTLPASLAAAVLGFITFYTGGVSLTLILLFFFITSSVIGKLTGGKNKREVKNTYQVLANGLPCAVALVFYLLPAKPYIALIAFAAALAEAEADCLASSIGSLSSKSPVSIISFTPVPKGISGAVTLLGLCSSVLGSSLIAVLFMGTIGCSTKEAAAIVIAGVMGSVFDSFLGATIQIMYRTKDGILTEEEKDEKGQKNERVRGISFVDNNTVNLLSGFFSLLIIFALV